MTLSIPTAVSYVSFGFLTLVGFIGFGLMPESVTASDVAKTVDELLQPGTAIDTDALIRVADSTYSVSYDDSVSMEPLSTHFVRKIGFGKSEMVTIVTTSSGTYSSDGLTSPHFNYPGIEVEDVSDQVLFSGFVWVAVTDAGSFLTMAPMIEAPADADDAMDCLVTRDDRSVVC